MKKLNLDKKYIIIGACIVVAIIVLIIVIIASLKDQDKDISTESARQTEMVISNTEQIFADTEAAITETQQQEVVGDLKKMENENLNQEETDISNTYKNSTGDHSVSNSQSSSALGEEIIILQDGTTIKASELETSISEPEKSPDNKTENEAEDNGNSQNNNSSAVIELPIIPID